MVFPGDCRKFIAECNGVFNSGQSGGKWVIVETLNGRAMVESNAESFRLGKVS